MGVRDYTGDGPRDPTPPPPGGDPSVQALLPQPTVKARLLDSGDEGGGEMQTLTLIQGSVEPFDVEIVDENGAARSIAGADHASFAVRRDLADSTDLLLLRKVDTNIVIDDTNMKLTCTMSQAQADALPVGVFVGQAAVRFGDDNNWKGTMPVRVNVIELGAPKTST